MRVGAVILGRLSSKRLPGKVLREVAGRPLLAYVLERVGRARGFDAVVVATSSDPSDDAIASWCQAHSVEVHRGALSDVLGRVISAAHEFDLDAVARVNADSPWVDPGLLEAAVAGMRTGSFDLVTNLRERAWPYGVSAEVAKVRTLEAIHVGAEDPAHLEHVTKAFYEHPERFSILDLRSNDSGESDLRLTIDSEEDLRRFERLLVTLGRPAREVTTQEVAAATKQLNDATTGATR